MPSVDGFSLALQAAGTSGSGSGAGLNVGNFSGWGGIPTLAKLHALAVYIRSSTLHNDHWRDTVGIELGIDNVTRWSSWYNVINAAIRKRQEVNTFVSNHDHDLDPISSEDWELLTKTHSFLQLFNEATLDAETDLSSISQALELMDILLQH